VRSELEQETPTVITHTTGKRHLIYLAYGLGYAVTQLRGELQLQWELADPPDPFPAPVTETLVQLECGLEGLASCPAFSRRRRLRAAAEALREALRHVRDALSRARGSPKHCAFIRYRQLAEAELYTAEFMLEAPHRDVPIEDGLWLRLRDKARDFWLELPLKLSRWAELGVSVAAVMHEAASPARDEAFSKLPLQHSSVLRGGLLGKVRFGVTPDGYVDYAQDVAQRDDYRVGYDWWLRGEVARYHARVLSRLLRPAKRKPKQPGANVGPHWHHLTLTMEGLALGLALSNPEATATEIARAMGCNRTAMYRWKKFSGYMKGRRFHPAPFPRGRHRRGRNGALELEAEDHRGQKR
jgi:hypothetical protein